MGILQADDVVDLIRTTLKELGRLKWEDISLDLQEYIVLSQLLKKEKVGYESGYGIQFDIKYRVGNQAKMTGLYATDDVDVDNFMAQGSIPWRHTTTNWALDRREISMNKEPARIVNLIEARRINALQSMAVLMESEFWAKPNTSANAKDLFGIDYWAVYNATEGFNGGDPSGFTSGCAGLPVATYENWKNYSGQYTSVTGADLIRKMRKALTMTNFTPPVPGVPSFTGQNRYGLYTTYDVIGAMEELLEAQNDNLGNDLASKDGAVTIRRIPVTYVPYLDSNSTKATADPIYGIDWSAFQPIFLQGEYMTETPNKPTATQHTVHVTFLDATLNYICRNRRKLFLLAKSDPAVGL